MRSFSYILIFSLLFTISCKNRDINEGEEFRPREVNEDFENFHFNTITYDGVEYLITERDNNNPHEGFGFMAFRANKIVEEQDSLMAHIKTISEMQKMIYSRLYGVSKSETDSLYKNMFTDFLLLEQTQLSSNPPEED